MLVLTVVAWLADRWHRWGQLPATYGHLQSIVDLVDDWGNGGKGRIWWGDKGPVPEGHDGINVRRMGTSAQKGAVREIQKGQFYVLM